MSKSAIHWTQTREGKARLSRIQKRRWTKLRNARILASENGEELPVQLKRKSKKRKKVAVTVVGGKLFQDALAEATTEIEKRVRESLAAEARSSFMWTTAVGERVAPRDMDEGHLRNTISFLQRRLVAAFGKVTWLYTTHDMIKALDAMLDEAKRRNIRV